MKMKIYFTFLSVFFVSFLFSQEPLTNNDAYITPLNSTLNINSADGLLQNDSDPNGDPLSIESFIIGGVEYDAGQNASFPQGNITISTDGSFTFNPSNGFTGSMPPIIYVVSDGTNDSFGSLFLSVPINGGPGAQNDFDTADINTPLNVSAPGVLSNDQFQDINSVNVVSFTINGTNYNAGQTANITGGSFSLFADGSFNFVPSGGFTGSVPEIEYTISAGGNSSTASLFLTVEETENIIEIQNLNSCNQGYTLDGTYKIQYSLRIRNMTEARDFNSSSIIQNIDFSKDLDAIYGAGCVTSIENFNINTVPTDDFIGNSYPVDFDLTAINQDFIDGTSSMIFSQEAIGNGRLYPRQILNIRFCVIVEPFCNGRPNPTPSGSGVDFNAVFQVNSTGGFFSEEFLLEDFHTTETIVTAGFYIPEGSPPINPDGTYDYTNTIVITNEGTATANNINFNLGLGNFIDDGISFITLTVTQVGGPAVTINPNFDGETNTFLLEPNNSLGPGESITLEVFHLTPPVPTQEQNNFSQPNFSQTQGILDGFDENLPENSRLFSFVIWEDNLGSHLDRYYPILDITEPAINDQCTCSTLGMSFELVSGAITEKTISNVNTSPNGVLEHEEITFQLSMTNVSPILDIIQLQLQDDLSGICGLDPLSISMPVIASSSATQNPNLNPNYDGVTDINIFDGTSGILETGQTIIVEITVVIFEQCIGQNTMNFQAVNPAGEVITSTSIIDVDPSTDTDNDGIPDFDDIDDDNDTILDIEETGGTDPLLDHDSDFIPDYRDTDFGADLNNDGIVDIFDFDSDGVPNHFDLDSDNDGLLDIYEVGNFGNDTGSNGRTDSPVGVNGLDDTLETNDTVNASVTYAMTNTDNDTRNNYLDIDSDADGIVDNIEAQLTDSYLPRDNVIDENGVDTAYPNGLVAIDTDGDDIPDYLDINSDGDLEDDVLEGWDFNNDGNPENVPLGIDADNDGLDDGFDIDIIQVIPDNAQIPTDFPNVDYDVTPERDWREPTAIVVLIDDVFETEGNDFQFTISLVLFSDNSIPVVSPTPIEITLSTTNGTLTSEPYQIAVSPFDYLALNNINIDIPAFTDTFQVTVTSLDDNISELDELFSLNGLITSSNTINTEILGEGTILDNEPLPSITMNNDTVFEGEFLEYEIVMDIPSSRPTEIMIGSFNNTAIADLDFIPVSTLLIIDGTLDPSAPNTTSSFTIETLLDNLNEPDEEYLDVIGTVMTSNIGNIDLTKLGTIIDIDPYPFLSINNYTVVEGETLEFTITMLNGQGEPMQNHLPIVFDIYTVDITTTNNRDYEYFPITDSIPASGISFTQLVRSFDDNLNEETESFNFTVEVTSGTISNPSNIVAGLGTIKDNDIPNLFSPNGDGQSDIFRIDGIEDFPNFKLFIIDRWGSEIYNYSNNGNPNPQWWDGTNNGRDVIEGVYFYTLDFNDGKTKPKTGFIQLVR
jgi:gliding motility-associated-like protein